MSWAPQAQLPTLAVSSSGCGGNAAVAAPAASAAAAAAEATSSVAQAVETPWQQVGLRAPQPAEAAAPAAPLSAAVLESRTDVKLRVWTSGLRFANQAPLAREGRGELVREALACAQRHSAVPAHWPAAFLRSGGWSAGSNEVTIAVDTRAFSDPAQSDAGRHLGFHGAVLQGLVRSRRQHFGRFFSERVWAPILAALAAAPPSEQPVTVHVLSFCKSGRHRSVGIASLIWEVARLTRWDIQVDHLSASSWWLGTCNNCRECQDASDPRKEIAVNAAVAAADVARLSFDAGQMSACR